MKEKGLLRAVDKIKGYGVSVEDDRGSQLSLSCDLAKTDFSKIKPLLYYILDKFSQRYFIVIKGIPYCFMPDAVYYLAYTRKNKSGYVKKKEFKQCKYFEICPGLREDFLPSNDGFLNPIQDLPDEIVLELTPRCNLACPLCFKTKSNQDIPLDDVKRIIDESLSLGIKSVRFTGGEPLLYENLKEVILYAKKRNFYITVNTNGSLFNDEVKRLFKENVDNVLVSLQGFNTRTEKKLCGSEIDFERKVMDILELSRYVPVVRIGTIISKTLFRNFDKYLYLIRRLDVFSWELYRPMTDKDEKEFKITKYEYIYLIKRMWREKKSGIMDVRIFNPLPFCITDDFSFSPYVLFGGYRDDGHSRMVYDCNGFRPSYPIYKYLGKDILEAWNHPFLKKMRSLSYLPEFCKKCFYLKWCKGGSRYMAKAEKKDYFSLDPLLKIPDY